MESFIYVTLKLQKVLYILYGFMQHKICRALSKDSCKTCIH
jgi:hypothetical protein